MDRPFLYEPEEQIERRKDFVEYLPVGGLSSYWERRGLLVSSGRLITNDDDDDTNIHTV